MTRHIGADVLASYREGEVGRRKAARIRAHLAGCARCSAVNSDLAAVSSVLAGVQLPPIPDRLATRIQSALAAESASRATQSAVLAAAASKPGAAAADAPQPAEIPGRPDLPERARRSRRPGRPDLTSPLVLRTLAAAGAVVLVAGGSYLLASGSSPSSSEPRTAGNPRPLPAGGVAPGSAEHQGVTFGLPYRRQGTVATTAALTSNVDFERATLGSQVRRQVASTSPKFNSGISPLPAGPDSSASPASTGTSAVLSGVNVPELEACVTLVAAGRDVLLVEVAHYQGDPATIIVRVQSPAAKTLDIVVVGRACSGTNAAVITEVMVPAS